MVGLISKPEVEYIQHVGDDLTFARAAWASTNQDGLLPSCTCNRVIHQEDCAISKFEKKYSGVINFLMKHHHMIRYGVSVWVKKNMELMTQ